MIQSLRRSVAVPNLNVEAVAGAATVGAFAWLLAHGYVRPIAVYLLELYLAF